MGAQNLTVRVTGELREFIERQTGSEGLYETPSEYIRDLIRRDRERCLQSGMGWLKAHLKPLMETPANKFVVVGAKDVKARVRRKYQEKGAKR